LTIAAVAAIKASETVPSTAAAPEAPGNPPSAATATLAAAPAANQPADYNSVYGEALNLWVPSEEASSAVIQVAALPTNGTVVLSDGSTRVTVGEQLTPAQAGGLRFKPNGAAQN